MWFGFNQYARKKKEQIFLLQKVRKGKCKRGGIKLRKRNLIKNFYKTYSNHMRGISVGTLFSSESKTLFLQFPVSDNGSGKL